MDLLIRVLAAIEEFRPRPYRDAVGVLTIGFGHVVRPGEGIGDRLTVDQAYELLARDVAPRRERVEALFGGSRSVFLSKHEIDALTSFEFNTGKLEESTLRQRLLSGSRLGASEEFGKWVYGTDGQGNKVKLDGLANRRAIECIWFLGAPEAVLARVVARFFRPLPE